MALNPIRRSNGAGPTPRLVQGATLLAGVSLVLVIVNIVLASINQSLQADVSQHQQTLQRAAQLGAVNNVLVHALVQQADTGTDAKIQDLLKRADIPFTATPKP